MPSGRLAAAVDDQAAVSEAVQADPRAEAPTGECGEAVDGGFGSAVERAQSPATARLSWVPTPRPTCSAGARIDRECGRTDRRSLGRQSRSATCSATRSARPASGPSARPSGGGLGRQLEARGVDHQADAAELAGAPGPSPAGRSGAGSGSGCGRRSWPSMVRVEPPPARPHAHMIAPAARTPRVPQGRRSSRPGGASLRKSARISSSGKNVDPGGQDRRLDDRVLGAVEAEEVAETALGHRLGHDRRPLLAVVELDDAELVIAAGVEEDPPRTTSAGRVGTSTGVADRGPGQQQDVVGDVEHPFAAAPSGCGRSSRSGYGRRTNRRIVGLDLRPHRRDVQVARPGPSVVTIPSRITARPRPRAAFLRSRWLTSGSVRNPQSSAWSWR